MAEEFARSSASIICWFYLWSNCLLVTFTVKLKVVGTASFFNTFFRSSREGPNTPNCYVRGAEFLTGPLEYKYRA